MQEYASNMHPPRTSRFPLYASFIRFWCGIAGNEENPHTASRVGVLEERGKLYHTANPCKACSTAFFFREPWGFIQIDF